MRLCPGCRQIPHFLTLTASPLGLAPLGLATDTPLGLGLATGTPLGLAAFALFAYGMPASGLKLADA